MIKRLFITLCIFFGSAFSLYAVCSGSSPDWYPNGGTSDFSTVTAAHVTECVSVASAGDTIHLPAGTASWSGGVTVNKGVYIIGQNSGCPSSCDDATTIS